MLAILSDAVIASSFSSATTTAAAPLVRSLGATVCSLAARRDISAASR